MIIGLPDVSTNDIQNGSAAIASTAQGGANAIGAIPVGILTVIIVIIIIIIVVWKILNKR